MAIAFVKGDVTSPQGEGKKIICHVCNDIGLMGAGVAAAIASKWPIVKKHYLEMKKDGYVLGSVQVIKIGEDLSVANMIGQHGVRSAWNPHPVRYDAIRTCLQKLKAVSKDRGASLHMPKIGSGLVGGDWSLILPLVEKELSDEGVLVTVYDIR